MFLADPAMLKYGKLSDGVLAARQMSSTDTCPYFSVERFKKELEIMMD
ncbi:hypothetical protein THAOC_24896, partial [Thalassiosira oceanica]